MKKCSKCGVEKDESEFWIRSSRKCGYASSCKPCCKEKRSRSNPEIREKLNSYRREYYKENSEKLIEVSRKFRKEQRERYNEIQRNSYWKNRDSIIQKRKEKGCNAYSKTNRDKKYEDPFFRKKHICRVILNRAVKDKKILKSEFCQICGSKGRIEGHHHDYDKPLEIIWVCRKCHIKIDPKQKGHANANQGNQST